MRIGVLGIGHIGLPIARFLHAVGNDVFTWSKTSSAYPWNHSTSLETIATQQLDYLLVASGSVRPGFGDFESEIKSTIDLIPSSLRHENTKILYLSSGAVYGECPTPKSEKDQVAPNTPYGKSKAVVEREFEKIFVDRFSALRIGNVIDWENPYGILAVAKKAKQTGLLDLFGNSEDCRDYLDINDLCLMISGILELNSNEKIMNLGSGISISLYELSEIISRVLPNLRIQWNPPRGSDISRTQLDISKVLDLTNVVPEDPRAIFVEYLQRVVYFG